MTEQDLDARARDFLADAYEQMGDRGNMAIAADIRSKVDSGYSARIALHAVKAALAERPVVDEIAWLIEWPATRQMPVRYWHPSEGHVIDPNHAVRFSRREDAEAMLKRDHLMEARAVEHMWCALSPPSASVEPCCERDSRHGGHQPWCPSSIYYQSQPSASVHARGEALAVAAFFLEQLGAPHMHESIPGAVRIQAEIIAKKARAALNTNREG